MKNLVCAGCKQDVEIYNATGRCKPCYNSYTALYMATLMKRRRAMAIASLGGSCDTCGGQEDMVFYRPGAGAGFKRNVAWSSKVETFKASLVGLKMMCRPCYLAWRGRIGNSLPVRMERYELLRRER